ncbi:MAG: DUF1963 domain-containing protein [Pseudomonadota bacterium]
MVAVIQKLGYFAPPVGLLGLGLLVLGVTRDPADIWMIRFGIPLIIFGLVLLPGRTHPLRAVFRRHPGRNRRPDDAPGTAPGTQSASPAQPTAVPATAKGEAHHSKTPPREPRPAPPQEAAIRLIAARDGVPGRSQSWLGGAPHLPAGMDWPRIGEVPMLFAAQVSLEDVPPDLWNGQGPRHGSLALFLPDGGNLGRDTRLIHLSGPLTPRAWPSIKTGFDYGHKGNVARDILRGISNGVAPHPPRFDLMMEPLGGPPVRGRPDLTNPGRDALRDETDLRNATIAPFDRASALALVLAHARVQKTALSARTHREAEATLESREAALAVLRAVEATVLSEETFTPAAAAALFDLLSSIETQHVRSAGQGAQGGGIVYRPILRDPRARPAYLAAFEMLVQTRLREDPSRLPPQVLTRFEAIWQADQARDYATMGGRAHSGYERGQGAGGVFLLELTSSERIGWHFGDGRHLGLFMTEEDLAQARFEAAWAEVST